MERQLHQTVQLIPGCLDYPKGKTSGIATVFQINAPSYSWKTTAFTPTFPDEDGSLWAFWSGILQTSIRSRASSIRSTTWSNLGINTIELMPVNEFEGNSSWGYNPNYYFAVDKYYGPKNDLKKLIDTLHQNGMAVILDVVYNHSFGTSPYVMLYWDKQNSRPAANSPFFNPIPKHDYNVGNDMNHESPSTKQYISNALKFWLREFRVDGFRFDLSKGLHRRIHSGTLLPLHCMMPQGCHPFGICWYCLESEPGGLCDPGTFCG